MNEIVSVINGYIWSNALIYLCLGAGLLFSILTRFIQVRLLSEMVHIIFSGKESNRGISSFQALAVSISGRVGVGNIAGVATAIGFGGPGAVFWMWFVAFLGAATACVESTLGQIYKEEIDGQLRGGPAFYLEKAMGQKWYSWIFALSTITAVGILLPGVQSNNIGNAAEVAFGTGSLITLFGNSVSSTKLITAVIISSGLIFIIFGGVKRIARFTQFAVPFMAIGYIFVAVIIIGLNISDLPNIISMIFKDAFSPMAGFGAAVGWGVKRGVYSNEAGQGTGPHAAAAAEVDHPAQQGLVQAFSVYVDTFLICSATAFIILISQQYYVDGVDKLISGGVLSAEVTINSPAFTQLALETVIGNLGKIFIAISLFFFAFTTIIAYYYIAETNFIWMKRTLKSLDQLIILKIIITVSVFFGTIRSADLAWALGDIGVGIMAWLNIIGILVLIFMGRPALKALDDYERQKKKGVSLYSFDPDSIGIKNADFCKK